MPTTATPSALASSIGSEPAQAVLTAADLASLPSHLSLGNVGYELHEGRLVVMPPPGDTHGAVDGNIIAALKYQGEFKGHGRARSEVGIVLSRGPDVVYGADAAFITNAGLPLRHTTEGYLETILELIVEVRSPNDTLAYLERKAQDYLRAGAVVVWVVNPAGRQVIEYRQGATRVFAENDTLAVDDLIPGFALLVRDALAE